jgi:hypothetical protein
MRATIIIAMTVLLGAGTVMGHGFLSKPPSRNYLHNSNNCPHCLNAGGTSQTKGSHYPRSRHGMCGDPASGPRPHEAGGRFATGKVTGYYRQGGRIRVTTSVATYHRGVIEYRVCRYRAGSAASERRALTESCLNEHVLRQASGGGGRYQYLGNRPETGYNPPKPYTATYRLPDDLVCDGKTWKCVLQMHWITGNTCSPAFLPKKYRVRGLGECGGSRGLWPEEFWNCADIVVLPKKH